MTPLDQAGEVRTGEALDLGRLEGYLAERLEGRAGGAVSVRQFRQGHSNLTYLVTVGSAEYVLRRPPFGNRVRTAHDMSREYRVLDALAPVFPAAPRPILFCEDETILGAPFYLMERHHGVVIRRTLPPELAAEPQAGGLCRALVDTLAALHAVDHQRIGLGDFGRPDGYVARQVSGWTARYEAAATDDVPAMGATAAWLDAHRPAERGAAIIHNDYKFDNVMFDPAGPPRVVAVLDWEMATVGDPLMDFGAALAYWVESGDPAALQRVAMGPTAAPGMWSRRQLVDAYADRTGRAIDDLEFYYVFGLFKLAVIVQQIYARYVRGATADARFAGMGAMVAVLADRADRVARGVDPI